MKSFIQTTDDPKNLQYVLKEHWKNLSKIEKNEFVKETPKRNPGKTYCICKKSCDEESARMVACDICDDWYHNDCINIDHAFAKAVSFFVCLCCLGSNFESMPEYVYHWFLTKFSKTSSTVSDVIAKYKTKDRYTINLLNSHRFYLNCEEVTFANYPPSVKCYSKRGIENSFNNCYASSVFQVLLGSAVSFFLPLSNNNMGDIGHDLYTLKKQLTNEDRPLEFDWSDWKNNDWESLCGCIINTAFDLEGYNYLDREMKDSEEFLSNIIHFYCLIKTKSIIHSLFIPSQYLNVYHATT